jgi:hypothetical protein
MAALVHLGKSLHPLQDWVAHGTWDPTYGLWNITNWRWHPKGADDFDKDDSRSADGRLQDDLTSDSNQEKYLVPGSKRAELTKKMTKERLLAFKRGIPRYGRCWCAVFKWEP